MPGRLTLRELLHRAETGTLQDRWVCLPSPEILGLDTECWLLEGTDGEISNSEALGVKVNVGTPPVVEMIA